MKGKQLKELNETIKGIAPSFRGNYGRFGLVYITADTKKNQMDCTIECSRETFKNMINRLLKDNNEIGEDIIEAVKMHLIDCLKTT